jgi:hypothetical protein
MVLRPVSDLRVVTRDGAALFGIDANCHEPLSQGGLPLRAIWHNGDITDVRRENGLVFRGIDVTLQMFLPPTLVPGQL